MEDDLQRVWQLPLDSRRNARGRPSMDTVAHVFARLCLFCEGSVNRALEPHRVHDPLYGMVVWSMVFQLL